MIKFKINIEATSCPEDRNQWKQSIRIYPVGVGVNESLIIDLELICGCDCENPGFRVSTKYLILFMLHFKGV